MKCDNVARCHAPVVIGDDSNATRVICSECKTIDIIRKNWRGVHENRQYSKFFRKDSLQPNTNLFYKYYGQHLLT